MDSLRFTFKSLKDQMSLVLTNGVGPSSASGPNLLSAMNSFMKERGFCDNDVIGSTLRASYQRNVSGHVRSLQSQGRPGPYISNRKSLLTHWRRALLDADKVTSARIGRDSPFQTALHEIIADGRTQKGTAKASGVPLATLKRWLKGCVPNSRSVIWVPRLERYFALPAGALSDLLPFSIAGGRTETPVHAPNEYRDRLREACREQYALKQPSDELREQWRRLVVFKTSIAKARRQRERNGNGERSSPESHERLKKQRGSRWSTTSLPVQEKTASRWFAFQGEQYVATASVNWQFVSQYLGWLMLSPDQGGLGLPEVEAMSLANLVREDYLEDYIQWRVERAGGKHNSGLMTFLTFVRGMCNPTTGYLTQTFEQFKSLAIAASDTEWREDCRITYEYAIEAMEDMSGLVARSRDPFKAIGPALALPNPLEAVADAVARMDADRPITGGLTEAVWARDRLLLTLLASNPLRDKNIRLLTYAADGTGHLRNVNGEWRVVVPRVEFKNANGAAKNREYDMPVRREIWGDIERYIRDYRPMIATIASPYFFVSARRPDKPMASLGRRFALLTKKYLAGCPGVGPHAMRHIVATSILKQNPNDWAAAAWALHDKEETVRKHYVHLRCDDAKRWMGPAMDGPFARM